jgi:DNA-binding IscR family transcriptional regulator
VVNRAEQRAVLRRFVPEDATVSIHAVMLTADVRMMDELASHSLADLASQVATKAPASFGVQVAMWIENCRSNSMRSKE